MSAAPVAASVAPAPVWPTPAALGVGLALVLAAAAAAVALPLATYTVSLATLGLPHVVAEVRYIDARFAPRAGRRLVGAVVALLGLVVLLRLAGLVGAAPAARLAALEVGVVAALGAVTLPALARRGAAALALGVAVVLGLGVGAASGSATLLVVLAGLHNLTPVGLLAERLRGPARARALGACALVFGLAPLVIASGVLQGWLGGGVRLDATPFASAGGVERSLGVFVPAAWLDAPLALPLFSAAAFLQVMHHAVVLGVLPRLDDAASWSRPRSAIAWPGRRALALLVALAGLGLLPAFVHDFALARRVYGLAAGVHAWLEVPALLLGLVPDRR